MRFNQLLNITTAYLPDLISDVSDWRTVTSSLPTKVAIARDLPDSNCCLEIGAMVPSTGTPDYHPIRGQGAISLLEGRVDVSIGHSRPSKRPPHACRLTLEPRTTLELTNPGTWVSFKPHGDGLYLRLWSNKELKPSGRPLYLVKIVHNRIRDILHKQTSEIFGLRARHLTAPSLLTKSKE